MLWKDLQTFLVETITYYVFDPIPSIGRCSLLNSDFIKLTKAATEGVL